MDIEVAYASRFCQALKEAGIPEAFQCKVIESPEFCEKLRAFARSELMPLALCPIELRFKEIEGILSMNGIKVKEAKRSDNFERNKFDLCCSLETGPVTLKWEFIVFDSIEGNKAIIDVGLFFGSTWLWSVFMPFNTAPDQDNFLPCIKTMMYSYIPIPKSSWFIQHCYFMNENLFEIKKEDGNLQLSSKQEIKSHLERMATTFLTCSGYIDRDHEPDEICCPQCGAKAEESHEGIFNTDSGRKVRQIYTCTGYCKIRVPKNPFKKQKLMFYFDENGIPVLAYCVRRENF